MKSGFITILGRPNVGKSSLMNALIGEKVSIVSPKAQTTRDRVNGILTTKEYQMVFVDTPGVHKPRTKLGEYMDKCIKNSTDGVDAVVIVLDGTKKILDGDFAFIEKYLKMPAPVYLVINKVDAVGYDKVYPMLEQLSYLMEKTDERNAVKEIVPLSAKRGKNVEVLKKYLVAELKEGPCYYPEDEITDKSERYMICEIVREKALLFLNDEIPHGIGVSIANMTYDENGVARIFVDITCERDSHKSIIIGAGGEKLKMIAERSRKEIERMLDSKVYMELFVKVRADWRNDGLVLSDIGYDPRKLKK
ncbi:MAG: GTPase Era [Clostridia bacterium]|nr:GTPase Era [Clostridia bacterium]